MRIGRFLLYSVSLLLIIKQVLEKLLGGRPWMWVRRLALSFTEIKSWAGFPTSPQSISLLETEDKASLV